MSARASKTQNGDFTVTGDLTVLGGINSSTTSKTQKSTETATVETVKLSGDMTTVQEELADISSDNVLSPSDKIITKGEWTNIQAEEPYVLTQAATRGFGVGDTEYDNFLSAYDDLDDYITPLLADMDSPSAIDGDTFRGYFSAYYEARQALFSAEDQVGDIVSDAVTDEGDPKYTLLLSDGSLMTQANDGLSDMKLDSGQLRFRSRVSGSAPWEEQAWMKKREESTLFDMSASGFMFGRGGLLSNLGMIWRSVDHPITAYSISRLNYGNGVWIATAPLQIARSIDDGESWGSLISNPFTGANILDAAYGNGVWIACGSSGQIARSTDNGVSWGSLISNPFGTDAVVSVTYGNGIWVAVGHNNKIARSSDDGVTWTSISNPFSCYYLRDIDYGNGVWVVVGDDGEIARSIDDGLSWGTLIDNPLYEEVTYINSVAYGNGVWVAVSTEGKIIRSIDGGAAWTLIEEQPFSASTTIYRIAYGNGVWVAVATSDGMVARSIDNGLSWIQQSYSISEILLPFGSSAVLPACAYGNNRFLIGGTESSAGIIGLSEWQEAGSGIVERGENSNGSYIKFSDGTMICWHSITGSSSAISDRNIGTYGWSYYIGADAITYPAEFINTPVVNGSGMSSTTSRELVSCDSVTTTGCRLVFWSGSSSLNEIGYIAIGRWK